VRKLSGAEPAARSRLVVRVPVAEFNFSEARLGLASVLPEITLYFKPYKTRSRNALLSCDWIIQENGSDLG
jgi:hypothetical protein